MRRFGFLFATAMLALLGLSSLKPVDGAAGVDKLNQVASKVLELSNQARQEQGVRGLSGVEHLDRAAHGHSDEMLRLDYFNHHSPTQGRGKPLQRVQLAGGIELKVAENIYKAFGYPPEEIAAASIRAFLKSPGHRRNLLNPDYNSLGVGVARKGDTVTVTQVFALRLLSLEDLQVQPSGSGFEVAMTCRVLEGAKNGAVFFNSKPVQRWQANADGIFNMKFKAPSPGAVQLAQANGSRFTVGAQFQLPR